MVSGLVSSAPEATEGDEEEQASHEFSRPFSTRFITLRFGKCHKEIFLPLWETSSGKILDERFVDPDLRSSRRPWCFGEKSVTSQLGPLSISKVGDQKPEISGRHISGHKI